jgi:hypothetical protein
VQRGLNGIAGRVVHGHGVASGRSASSPYPRGTIALQAPHFLERGVDLSPFFAGTLNVDITPHAAVPPEVAHGTADPLAVVDGEPEADESPFSAHVVEHGEGTGCRFRPRCPVAMEKCVVEPGLLARRQDPTHAAACWHAEDGS